MNEDNPDSLVVTSKKNNSKKHKLISDSLTKKKKCLPYLRKYNCDGDEVSQNSKSHHEISAQNPLSQVFGNSILNKNIINLDSEMISSLVQINLQNPLSPPFSDSFDSWIASYDEMQDDNALNNEINCTEFKFNDIFTPSFPYSASPVNASKNHSNNSTSNLLCEKNLTELHNWIKTFESWNATQRSFALQKLIDVCSSSQIKFLMSLIRPLFQRDFIQLLPKEISLNVLSYLSPNDLLKCACVCQNWKYISSDPLLWRKKCDEQSVQQDVTDLTAECIGLRNDECIKTWKAAYIRAKKIQLNWMKRPLVNRKILKGHDDHVITCLQFNDTYIVSGSDDCNLNVWCAKTGMLLKTLTGHTGGVWCSEMTGNIVISGSTDRTLKIWDIERGFCMHTLYGHTSTVRCMSLKDLKVVSGSRDANLRIWDCSTGSCMGVFIGHAAAVRCVQYNGVYVVSGAYDYIIRVWHPDSQHCIYILSGHINRVYSLQFDGKFIISGSLDTNIRVWDVETGQCIHVLTGHQSLTSRLKLIDKILVSGNADSLIKIWNIETGQCLHTLQGQHKHLSAVTCLEFNGNFVITSSDDGTVKLWNARTGEFIRDLVILPSRGSGGVIWRILSSDTKLICAAGSKNGTEDTKLIVIDFEDTRWTSLEENSELSNFIEIIDTNICSVFQN